MVKCQICGQDDLKRINRKHLSSKRHQSALAKTRPLTKIASKILKYLIPLILGIVLMPVLGYVNNNFLLIGLTQPRLTLIGSSPLDPNQAIFNLENEGWVELNDIRVRMKYACEPTLDFISAQFEGETKGPIQREVFLEPPIYNLRPTEVRGLLLYDEFLKIEDQDNPSCLHYVVYYPIYDLNTVAEGATISVDELEQFLEYYFTPAHQIILLGYNEKSKKATVKEVFRHTESTKICSTCVLLFEVETDKGNFYFQFDEISILTESILDYNSLKEMLTYPMQNLHLNENPAHEYDCGEECKINICEKINEERERLFRLEQTRYAELLEDYCGDY